MISWQPNSCLTAELLFVVCLLIMLIAVIAKLNVALNEHIKPVFVTLVSDCNMYCNHIHFNQCGH